MNINMTNIARYHFDMIEWTCFLVLVAVVQVMPQGVARSRTFLKTSGEFPARVAWNVLNIHHL